VYSVAADSPFHGRAREWLEKVLRGRVQVAIPWQSIGAFLRISTNHRAVGHPLTPDEAWANVEAWLSASVVTIPVASRHTARILGELVRRHHVTANLVPDAQLAALALEHGLMVMSADTDFARFSEITWENPLTG